MPGRARRTGYDRGAGGARFNCGYTHLRVEYSKVKRMVESVPASVRPPRAPATLLELVPSPATGPAECVIELEGPRGKMRIYWIGATPPDLAGLSRVLCESA